MPLTLPFTKPGLTTRGDRNTCCDKFEIWLDTGESFGNESATEERRQMLLRHLHELKFQDLECFCWPNRCHCETLAVRANRERRTL